MTLQFFKMEIYILDSAIYKTLILFYYFFKIESFLSETLKMMNGSFLLFICRTFILSSDL